MQKVATLQKAVPKDLGTRDAFHVPAILCRSKEQLTAGMSVRFKDKNQPIVTYAGDEARDGIVDPFIPTHATPGDSFWVFIDPSLVDKFQHAFDIKGFPTLAELKEKEAQERADELYADDGCRGCYS